MVRHRGVSISLPMTVTALAARKPMIAPSSKEYHKQFKTKYLHAQRTVIVYWRNCEATSIRIQVTWFICTVGCVRLEHSLQTVCKLLFLEHLSDIDCCGNRSMLDIMFILIGSRQSRMRHRLSSTRPDMIIDLTQKIWIRKKTPKWLWKITLEQDNWNGTLIVSKSPNSEKWKLSWLGISLFF